MTRREWVEWLVWLSGGAAIADDPRGPAAPAPRAGGAGPALRWFHVAADDFVVDIWHNGVALPDSARELVQEVHGATVERVACEARPGDWLAFHVVNNRLRWGGAKFFGFAGFAAAGDPAMVSECESGRWTCCENPAEVPTFLGAAASLADRPVQAIAQPWDGGRPPLDAAVGGTWSGTPIWGPSARSVWLKARLPA